MSCTSYFIDPLSIKQLLLRHPGSPLFHCFWLSLFVLRARRVPHKGMGNGVIEKFGIKTTN